MCNRDADHAPNDTYHAPNDTRHAHNTSNHAPNTFNHASNAAASAEFDRQFEGALWATDSEAVTTPSGIIGYAASRGDNPTTTAYNGSKVPDHIRDTTTSYGNPIAEEHDSAVVAATAPNRHDNATPSARNTPLVARHPANRPATPTSVDSRYLEKSWAPPVDTSQAATRRNSSNSRWSADRNSSGNEAEQGEMNEDNEAERNDSFVRFAASNVTSTIA